jgi:hypothetical protein
MANEEELSLWIKLVIDGENVGQAVGIEIKSEMDVDDLKQVIMEKAKRRFDKDIHSLNVYLPGTNALDPADGAYLCPGLELLSPEFPKDTTDQKPLIVTAKSRQDTNVSLVYA